MPETTPDHSAEIERLRRSAEAVLRESVSVDICLEAVELLRQRGRNRVLRCRVAGDTPDLPATVIVKASVGEGDNAYVRGSECDSATRFRNEWAATRFLSARPADPPLCARLIGADPDAGAIVVEDLGAPDSMADHMTAEDPVALEEALFAYASSMGRLHAVTVGHISEFERVWAETGGGRATEQTGSEWAGKEVAAFLDRCVALGVAIPSGFDAEIELVRAHMDDPGPFLAFTPGDTCPDNHRLIGNGAVRFFDFEYAGFQHALLDAAYLLVPFPTCWCVNRLPAALEPRLEDAYRRELARGCPEAEDDALFTSSLVDACGYWTVMTVADSLEGALKEDTVWGISTQRQRLLFRLQRFAEMSEKRGRLPAMGRCSQGLYNRLRAEWQDVEEMPLYKAFRPR